MIETLSINPWIIGLLTIVGGSSFIFVVMFIAILILGIFDKGLLVDKIKLSANLALIFAILYAFVALLYILIKAIF